MYRSALDPHWLSPQRAPPAQEDANNNTIGSVSNNPLGNHSNAIDSKLIGNLSNEDNEDSDTSAPSVKIMKYTGGDSDIMGMPMDTLLYTWNDEPFLTDGNNKQILIGGVMDDDEDDQKPTLEEIESMLITSNGSEQNNNLAELKPLPPFTGEFKVLQKRIESNMSGKLKVIKKKRKKKRNMLSCVIIMINVNFLRTEIDLGIFYVTYL